MCLRFQNLSFNPMQNSILEQAKLDHEIRQIWFSTRKKKYNLVFYFLNVYVSWIQWEKILISQLTPPKFRYFAYQNGWKEDPMKLNFGNFQIQKWISQTIRAEKVDEKNWVICLISIFFSWVLVLKLPKIVHFCKFVLISAKSLNILKNSFLSICKTSSCSFRK